ncbi:MAG: hypothetical protein HY673_20570 [Chloroflexi bacterium]|nr:hypothetical protein [Chloroflexota bacterium]
MRMEIAADRHGGLWYRGEFAEQHLSDKTFESSIKLLTLVVVLGAIAGVILGAGLVLAVFGAILVEVGVGGFLLHLWGKSYMSRQ